MTALHRKLLRDLGGMKTQALAIALVVACGVAVLVMSLSTLTSLREGRAAYYERSRFAEVFAQVKRAPRTLEQRIEAIPGVRTVETRVVRDVTLDVPGLIEPATGRLISIPDEREARLNLVHLRLGRMPEPDRPEEVVVCEAFAEAHDFVPGNRVRAIINGRLQELVIVGIVLSPEYIYQIRPGDLMPDDRRFGIFWMGYTALAEAFDMEGAFNDIALTLDRDAGGTLEAAVIEQLDELLERYGSGGAYGRDDQLSHRYVSDELRQLATTAVLPPSIFLGVAAFLVGTVLARIIRMQREQIAALKAFGYTGGQIARHYLGFVLIICAVGSVLGVVLGWQLGRAMTALYAQFFRFPSFGFTLDTRAIWIGILASTGLGAFGAMRSLRHAASLPPAEAMRPEPPPEYKPTLVERIGLQRFFAAPSRMILRKLESHPWRAAMTVFGLSLGTAVLIVGNFSLDAVGEMIDLEFRRVQRQDVTVTLVESIGRDGMHELAALPGVIRSEPFRAVPVRAIAGHRQERLSLMGLQPDPSLRRVLDLDGRPVQLPPEGVVISEKLAELLHLTEGDVLRLEILEDRRPERTVVVARIVAGYLGISAFMDINALNRLMREGPSVSGAFLQVDAERTDDLFHQLKRTPRVAGVTIKNAAVESFENTIAENLLRMRAIQVMFASVICFGVVYNAARITLSERSRELASMRVLGFTRSEVSFVLLGELAVLLALAVPLGLFLGWGMAWSLVQSLATESYTIPLVIRPATYASAVVTVLIASVLSAWVVRRSIDRLDMVAVLKAA